MQQNTQMQASVQQQPQQQQQQQQVQLAQNSTQQPNTQQQQQPQQNVTTTQQQLQQRKPIWSGQLQWQETVSNFYFLRNNSRIERIAYIHVNEVEGTS